MGCCPSKHKGTSKAQGGDGAIAHEERAVEKTSDVTQCDRPLGDLLPVVKANPIDGMVDQAPTDMLMDRGDGFAIEKSDSTHEHGAIKVSILDEIRAPILEVIEIKRREEAVPKVEERAVALVAPMKTYETPESPPRPQYNMPPSPSPPPIASSPTKPPVNYEEMPINSMYHRIHLVEVEEMEEKRRQELHQEAERREREIQEFKASMLASTHQ